MFMNLHLNLNVNPDRTQIIMKLQLVALGQWYRGFHVWMMHLAPLLISVQQP